MANRDGREALRGAEEETFDLIAQVLTSDQWAELLKAPLERAALQGNRGLAQKLVGAGAQIGDALHASARGGHEEIMNDLLRNGASVAAKERSRDGYTPLHWAAREGKTGMVELLLLKGADKDALDNDEYAPLFLAVLFDHVAAALALLAAGADVSRRCGHFKESVVHMAAGGGHVEILRAVIERGADVDAADTSQGTPLHGAVLSNNVETIDVLVEAGANMEARDSGGRTPLQVAVRSDKLEAIDVLVEAGANIEAQDDHGWTPLHGAACSANVAALLALLRHGAHVNAKNDNQETPLHWAAGVAGRQGAAEMVDSLLRSGADETILDDEGETAADMVGEGVEEEDQLAEDADRVRQLLANAPADRAWRRRGYLVLCRAHPDRMRQMYENSNENAGVGRRARNCAKLARTETGSCTGTAGGSMVGGRTGGNWAVVVARVLGLQEEGIFRTIVGYL